MQRAKSLFIYGSIFFLKQCISFHEIKKRDVTPLPGDTYNADFEIESKVKQVLVANDQGKSRNTFAVIESKKGEKNGVVMGFVRQLHSYFDNTQIFLLRLVTFIVFDCSYILQDL